MQRTEDQPSPLELPSREAGEGVTLWFALGFPMLTFFCWLAGLFLLHPWAGFVTGIVASIFIGKRLIAKN